MVYIVSSYDFGGSSYVQLHIVTNDKEKAQKKQEIIKAIKILKYSIETAKYKYNGCGRYNKRD